MTTGNGALCSLCGCGLTPLVVVMGVAVRPWLSAVHGTEGQSIAVLLGFVRDNLYLVDLTFRVELLPNHPRSPSSWACVASLLFASDTWTRTQGHSTVALSLSLLSPYLWARAWLRLSSSFSRADFVGCFVARDTLRGAHALSMTLWKGVNKSKGFSLFPARYWLISVSRPMNFIFHSDFILKERL